METVNRKISAVLNHFMENGPKKAKCSLIVLVNYLCLVVIKLRLESIIEPIRDEKLETSVEVTRAVDAKAGDRAATGAADTDRVGTAEAEAGG
ncbi:unnamed protein product [Euphydryas editha]|uniref:Uncharacterized protein n=1 Tax=Euphydryas editha TaxID=104508 RepID=A0AAU9UPL6_EUPED|nr:unnamed protein product [Euphydryas editha]